MMVSKNSKQTVSKLLQKLNKETIIDFLVDYAESDPRFINAVNVRFGKPEFENEVNKIEEKIDNALAGASDYRRQGGWGYIDFDVSDIVNEIKLRADQGHIKLAFMEIELLYRKLLEIFEYQSECEVSDEAENCFVVMSEIADKAVLAEDKEYIFRQCIELSGVEDGKDYGADYEDKLLGVAAKVVTPENVNELKNVLEKFNSSWREEEFTLIQLEIIKRIEGKNASDIFITKNLHFPKIREIAFNKAMACKNYKESERLCIDAFVGHEEQDDHPDWLCKLYSVYEKTRNTVKMTETAENILLNGNIDYYEKLKSLLKKQGIWDSSYSELLQKCNLKLSHFDYMDILAKEKEYFLLLEQVKKHKEQIYDYGKLLAKKYPADVSAIFIRQISKEAEIVHGRESYRRVCSYISCFSEAGFRLESAEMIERFKIKYKRKPAFVDELNKL
jgi:hypothetical protein